MQNKSRLKIWVCEYVSAGGLASEPLPDSLLQEGLLMRDALLADLSALGVDCITSHDMRVPAPQHAASVPVQSTQDAQAIWRQQVAAHDVDACWVIAPETAGALQQMQAWVTQAGKSWIGCRAEAIRQTTSKSLMADRCRQAGVLVLPHIFLQPEIDLSSLPWQGKAPYGWVLKPDDGAGCELTYYFKNNNELLEFKYKFYSNIDRPARRFLLQPYLPGLALSMSVVSTDTQVKVIAGHRQSVEIEGDQFHFKGAGVNAAADYLPMMQQMAEDIHRVIPGLMGYWGADLILTDDHQLCLVEINPRLTTPYIGLSRLLTENPASLILDAVLENSLTVIEASASLALYLPATQPREAQ